MTQGDARRRTASFASWAGVLGFALFAGARRWSGFWDGYTSDELCNYTGLDALGIALSPESGVNPPLLRLMFNGMFDDLRAVDWGRRFAFACSVAAVGWAFKLGELVAAGRWLGGAVCAYLLATSPWAVVEGTTFRSYSPWLLFATWHLYAVLRFDADGPAGERRWGAHLAVTAIVLPWLHYVSVPLLGCLALTSRRRLAWYVPAACAALPLVYLIAALPGEREPAGLGVGGVQYAFELAMGGEGLGGKPQLLAALTAFSLWLRPRHGLTLWVGLGAVFASLLLMSVGHFVRPSGVIWALPFLGALCGGVAALERPRGLGSLACAALLGWLHLGAESGRHQQRKGCCDQVMWAGRQLHRWDAVRGGRPVWVSPSYQLDGIRYQLAPAPRTTDVAQPPCRQSLQGCERIAGVDLVAFDALAAGPVPDGLVLHFSDQPLPALAAGCRVLRDEPCAHYYDCRPSNGVTPHSPRASP